MHGLVARPVFSSRALVMVSQKVNDEEIICLFFIVYLISFYNSKLMLLVNDQCLFDVYYCSVFLCR